MDSPPETEASACYFYNRVQGDKIRFVSYHFEGETESIKLYEDTAQALSMIIPPIHKEN